MYIIAATIFTLPGSLVGGGINQSYEVDVAHFRLKCLDDNLGNIRISLSDGHLS